MMRNISPLRYPGGKTIIRKRIQAIIGENQPVDKFVEAYAGGAGLGLWLLDEKIIKHLVINDKDEFVYQFWHALFFDTSELIDKIMSANIDIEEWEKQRQLITNPDVLHNSTPSDIGFAALFLNRCNRSGIIRGDVGPIGGKKQNSKWKIDVRFNKEAIIEKIRYIASKRENISLHNLDAIELIEMYTFSSQSATMPLFYLDPPYYKNGNSLYRSYYRDEDHRELQKYLSSKKELRWILSYDDSDFIHELYSVFNVHKLAIRHHANKVKDVKELLITPSLITWPDFL